MEKQQGLFKRFLAQDARDKEEYERKRRERFTLLKELLYDHLPPHLKKFLGEGREENIILFMASMDDAQAELGFFINDPERADREYGVRSEKDLRQRVEELRRIWKRHISLKLTVDFPGARYTLHLKPA